LVKRKSGSTLFSSRNADISERGADRQEQTLSWGFGEPGKRWRALKPTNDGDDLQRRNEVRTRKKGGSLLLCGKGKIWV